MLHQKRIQIGSTSQQSSCSRGCQSHLQVIGCQCKYSKLHKSMSHSVSCYVNYTDPLSTTLSGFNVAPLGFGENCDSQTSHFIIRRYIFSIFCFAYYDIILLAPNGMDSNGIWLLQSKDSLIMSLYVLFG